MAQESEEVIFNFDGRLIKIVRYSNETSEFFGERSSFILTFRNQPNLFHQAVSLSFYHCNKIFKGVIYAPDIEEKLQKFRKLHQENLSE